MQAPPRQEIAGSFGGEDAPVIENALRSEDDILSVVERELTAMMQNPTYPLPDAEDALREPAGQAYYEMRYSETRFNLNGVLGKISHLQFSDMIRAAVFDKTRRFRALAPTGEWRPLAWGLVRSSRARIARQFSGHTEEDSHVPNLERGGMYKSARSSANVQVTELVQIQDQNLMLEVAYIDILQGAPVDLLFAQKQLVISPYRRYTETRLLRHLPPRWQRERHQAKALIRRFYSIEVDDSDLGLSEDDLNRLEAFVRMGLPASDMGKLMDLHISAIETLIATHFPNLPESDDEPLAHTLALEREQETGE